MTHCTKVSASCHLKRGPLPRGHGEARPLACDIRYGSPRRVSLFCYSASSLGRSPGSCRMPRTPLPRSRFDDRRLGPGVVPPAMRLTLFLLLSHDCRLARIWLSTAWTHASRSSYVVASKCHVWPVRDTMMNSKFSSCSGTQEDGGGVKSLALTRPGPQRRSSVLRGFWAQGARAGLAACRLQSRVRRPAAPWALHPGPLAQPFRPSPRGRER